MKKTKTRQNISPAVSKAEVSLASHQQTIHPKTLTVYKKNKKAVLLKKISKKPKRAKEFSAAIKARQKAFAIFSKALTPILTAKIGSVLQNNLGNLLPKILYLNIDGFGPAMIIENRPCRVYFSAWNLTDEPVKGFVGASILPKHSVVAYEGLFQFPLDLAPGEYMQGCLSFIAPRADLDNQITLYTRVRGESQLIIATEQFDVGARFSLGISAIRLNAIASYFNDTVYASVAGMRDSVTWKDSNNFGQQHVGGVVGAPFTTPGPLKDIGPFNMMPDDVEGVSMAYLIANWGYSATSDEMKKVLDDISKISAGVAAGVLTVAFPAGAAAWAAISTGLDALTELINDTIFSDCDTVVVNDADHYTVEQLLALTFDPYDNKNTFEIWKTYTKKAGTKIFNLLGDGCEDAIYTVRITGTRYRVYDGVHTAGTDGKLVAPGQVENFGVGVLGNPTAIEYDVEGGGHIDEFGNYLAPPAPTSMKYDVILYKEFDGTDYVETDFAIVVLE